MTAVSSSTPVAVVSDPKTVDLRRRALGAPLGSTGVESVSRRTMLFAQPRRVAVALFLLLPLIVTYPIVRAPHRIGYFNHPDALLNMWIPAWETHALLTHPTHLFDANIFHPHTRTLLLSETLFGYLPIAAPVLIAGGSPALAFNLVLWLTFMLTGLSMYLLAKRLTGNHWAALLAGCMYALLPYRFAHIPQIQLEAMFGFPLAFLYLDRFWASGRLRDAVWVGVVFIVQTLCCVYYGLFLGTVLGLGLVVPLFAPFNFERRRFVVMALVFVAAVLVMAPLLREYVAVEHDMDLERTLREIGAKAATAGDYLASVSWLHRGLWTAPSTTPKPHDFLFPGIVAAMLAAVGIVRSTFPDASTAGLSRRRAIVYGLVAVFGFWASLGPRGLLFGWMYELIPLFHGVRAVSRFGVLTLFSLAVFAAFGAAFIDDRISRSRRTWWRGAVLALVVVETMTAPLGKDAASDATLGRLPRTPTVYSWLAKQPGDFVIAELPATGGHDFWRDAPYVYWSTVHWKRLVNGYSGFAPPDYVSVAGRLEGFPSAASKQILANAQVRFVIRHWSTESREEQAALRERVARSGWLDLAAAFPDCDVYEVRVES